MEQYDSVLLGILQNEGKVAPFLDVILGFLYRRTDFFRIMKTETDKLGFPPGVAKKLLMNIYSKYEMQTQKDAAKLEEMKRAKDAKAEQNVKDVYEKSTLPNSPTANRESKEGTSTSSSSEATKDEASETSLNKCEDEKGKEEDANFPQENPSKMDTDPQPEEWASNPTDKAEISKDKDKDTEENEDPEQVRQRRLLQANPLTYNGAERDNYLWSQTISEADLRVKIPKFVIKGKQVRVDISKKHVCVTHQQEDSSWCTVVDSRLAWEIKAEESMWTLTPGEFVHINMEKKEERWWECVFEGEPKINTRKIDCSRPMADLDDEAQAKIEEMMYNQRQKQLGLPQSHEQKTHEILRKAWDAEGSPFKGQTFDPSQFNVDANGVINMNQP